jgi:hypothetical protein
MITLALTWRVSVVPASGERRDCRDQAWARFMAECGLLSVLLPSFTGTALALCQGAGVALFRRVFGVE